jgi:8-hydroxy-5-deazaflavin:NADPH oxidoreductase
MTTIGLIGSGHIGSTLARLAVGAGHDVVLSNSRGPGTLADLVADLGDRARAATVTDAAEAGDVVVVTIPLKAYREVPARPLAGKVVLDTLNYYPDRDGHLAELDEERTTTSELVQGHLSSSRVVKVFNSIMFHSLAELGRPAGDPRRSALPIAGDDPDAKAAAAAFLDSVGYDAHDAGPLAEGWRYQRDTPAYVIPYADPEHDMAPRPATAADLIPLLAAARRYRDMP